MHVVWGRRHHDGGVVLGHNAGEFVGDPGRRKGQIVVHRDLEGRVQEDRNEPLERRRGLGLFAPARPLRLETEAGDHVDHLPAAVA
jgi:hypothetical protein